MEMHMQMQMEMERTEAAGRIRKGGGRRKGKRKSQGAMASFQSALMNKPSWSSTNQMTKILLQ